MVQDLTISNRLYYRSSANEELVAFANSLDPDHCRQNVGPDLDQTNCVPERIF